MSGCKRPLLRRFAADETAATAIEYAMIAAGVGVAVASTVWAIGDEVKKNFYEKLANML